MNALRSDIVANLPYLKSSGNGDGCIEINQLPDSIFIDANKVVAIYNARILSIEDKHNMGVVNGGPDVLLKSATGGQKLITRAELSQGFLHPNGKKIKIAFLNVGTSYIVVAPCNEKFKILKLPSNCSGILRGKQVQPNSYIVCPSNADGTAQTDRAYVISEKLFRKMFKVPMQDVIRNNMKGSPTPSFNFKQWENRGKRRTSSTIPSNSFGAAPSNSFGVAPSSGFGAFNKTNKPSGFGSQPNSGFGKFNGTNNQKSTISFEKPQSTVSFDKPQRANNTAQPKPVNLGGMRGSNQHQQMAPQQTGNYRFKAVARLVKVTGSSTKSLVGFVVEDLQRHIKKNITIDQMKQLCERRLVENIMSVNKEGTELKFLRGNGIRIESLPEMLV